MNDVAIVGGGVVGACAAALLRRGGLEVTLLEPQPPAAPEPHAPFDARVVALSRASERTLRCAGAWTQIEGPRLSPYERMCIWHESVPVASSGALVFDAADVGEPNLGYIVENRLLQWALLQAYTSAGGRLQRAALTDLSVTPEGVTLNTTTDEVRARLVVGADGAHSALRAAAALTAVRGDYHQIALVANVATDTPHGHTAWQRFMHDGTLAFLPLADGTSSIVWSADEARAHELLAMGPVEFEQALARASDRVLGATRLTTERGSFVLQRLRAPHYVAPRVALIGDAAHVVHPLAGQGVNLGLLDAAALAELVLEAVARREDPGALSVLRAYERWRKSELALMAGAIDAFDRFLAHGSGPLSRLAQAGLGVVNRSAELKRLFVRRALGASGELPRAAR
jgi:2-polyprenylphenol 6-hydroxylase